MISIVINCDTRPGCGSEVNTTGDYGGGSLNGVRSWDFLTDGVANKLKFFAGHECELILYIDQHDPVPSSVIKRIDEITSEHPEVSKRAFVCKPHQRSVSCWNELIYLEALKLAKGDYIAHFDGDCAAFRAPGSGIIHSYIECLENTFKFICQPTTMNLEDHGMWWASSRFFICKRETLDFIELERCIREEPYRSSTYGHCPAFEHVLARVGGAHCVLYPKANWDIYMIFCWSRYHSGLLGKLNALPYEKVRDYILACGIHGPNDVVSIPFEEFQDVADLERN